MSDYICKSQICNANSTNLLDDTLENYSEVLDSKLRKMRDVPVKIAVPCETKPTFYKVRPVPYAVKEKAEN